MYPSAPFLLHIKPTKQIVQDLMAGEVASVSPSHISFQNISLLHIILHKIYLFSSVI